jgi:hypothetical protein
VSAAFSADSSTSLLDTQSLLVAVCILPKLLRSNMALICDAVCAVIGCALLLSAAGAHEAEVR